MLTLVLQILLLLFLLLYILFTIVFVIFLIITPFLSAPFITTRTSILREIKKALAMRDGDILYDLGCGDGKVLSYCIGRSLTSKGVGIEINIFPYLLAVLCTRSSNIRIRFENIFKTSLHDATHIYLYISPKALVTLETKIQKECKKGTRIVSCDFQFPNLTSDEVITLENTGQVLGKKLYVYTLK